MMMMSTRAQWPHSIEDVYKSLDGIWGLVGATGTNGNLYRLERSLKEPVNYTVTEYNGNDESEVIKKATYTAQQREEAVKDFARSLGFAV
jgi:hypothetical protein